MLFSSLEILFRHKWRYLLLLVVLPLIGAAFMIPLYPKSTASESIWVNDQTYVNATTPTYDAYLTPAQVSLSNMTQYFQTAAFADAVVKKLDQEQAFTSAAEATSTKNSLATGLSGSAGGSNLLTLDYVCTRASLCPLVLTAAVQVFESYEAQVQAEQAKTAAQIYDKQLHQTQQALQQAQQQLSTYLAAHPGESAGQTSSDPALAGLVQNVTTQQSAVADAQSKLAGVTSTLQATQQASTSLYQVMDRARTISGRLSSLPTKQMLIVFAVFWGLAALTLLLTTRLARVVRHPSQVERSLGVPLATVIAPLPASGSGVIRQLRAGEAQ